MDAVNAVNAHFVSAATSCGAPRADVVGTTRALAEAHPPADRSLRLKPFTTLEVYRILSHGVARKQTKDVFEISVYLLHSAAEQIAPVLSCLYNRCCKEGRYPAALKRIKVSPLYKGKGKQEDLSNYRPVSIIPAVAKVFEYGLGTRLTEFLVQCEALSDRQYAYRKERSTTSLAKEVVREILEARESRKQVAVIFCDLSKAFDVADHEVLAVKLKHYGIDGSVLQLLNDFMTNRHQIVVGDGGRVRSEPRKTVIGVAQGSSLSNIMFSLLLNDLPTNVPNGSIYMYADDEAAIVTAPTVDQFEICISSWSTVGAVSEIKCLVA